MSEWSAAVTSDTASDTHRIVVGLGFGDEGKGATVDKLCSLGGSGSVVRFSGGPQAAHNVVVGKRHHTFRQFGSGTLAGVPTFLSRHTAISSTLLAHESEQLTALGVTDPLEMMTVSPDSLLVTPVHVAANRTREDLRGGSRHGSCGLGVGETTWYDLATEQELKRDDVLFDIPAPSDTGDTALRVRDCLDPATVRRKLSAMTRFYAPLLQQGRHPVPSRSDLAAMATELVEFARAVAVVPDAEHLRKVVEKRGTLVFEGSQGVLLDEWWGFHPHTTWSTTTAENAQNLLREAGLPRGEVWGVTRIYGTRHGAGPFPAEDPSLLDDFPEPHNSHGEYQGSWRVGHLDLGLLEYAARVCAAHGGLDRLAVNHLDLAAAVKVADTRIPDHPAQRDLEAQARLTDVLFTTGCAVRDVEGGDVGKLIASRLGVPPGMRAHGPGREARTILNWGDRDPACRVRRRPC